MVADIDEINWIRLGKEIANTTNGFVILRLLQYHGITHFTRYQDHNIAQQCEISMVLDYAHKEK